MKRLSLAIIFACCTLVMAAQKGIEVRFLGTSPDIIDFAWSFATASEAPGFEVEYVNTTYSLPRTGKDITVTRWDKNGTKTQQTLKWNDGRFSY